MPFAKCKFYTESGEPLRGGCRRKGAGCAFIHPDEPNWANARPASLKPRDNPSGSGGPNPWSEWGRRSAPAPSAWDTGGSTGASVPDTGGGWDTGGGEGADGGWGGGWGTGDSTLTPSQTVESTQLKSGGWGNTGNDGWGTSGWGDDKGTDKATRRGTGSADNDGWGTGWDNTNVADDNLGSTQGSAQGDGRGTGWGNPTSSWDNSGTMVADDQATKGSEQGKGKGKAVIAPPRIRISDNKNKKAKASGTNNEPLGSNKSRGSNHTATSSPVTALTPVATSTPTDSTRVKRKRDVAFDDQLEVIKDYVRAWERAVRTRFLLAEAESKRNRWFRTQKSACYARIGEAGRKRLDDQRTECDKEVNSQWEKLSAAIKLLMDFHDTMSSNLDLGQRYNIGEETAKFISESKAFVDEARALLVANILKDKSEVQPSNIQKPTSDVNPIESLQNQVQRLEERFEQAQTDLTHHRQRDIRCDIDGVLAAKIQALRVARQHKIVRVASRPEILIPPGALEDMKGTAQQVCEIEAKVPHTVEDIRVLLLRVGAMSQRVDELEKEVSKNKETYHKVQDMTAERERIEQRMDTQLRNIRGQFEQLVTSQLPGPAAQAVASPIVYDVQNQLMENLRPVFEMALDKFYESDVQPTIESLRQVVIEASGRQQEEAIKVLWGKIQPAMNMVAGVSRWLDSQELGLTTPVEANPVSAADPRTFASLHVGREARVMMKERRCNLFDDNGRPRRRKDGTKGCYRDASACHFAHPHEREWETAHPSLPPRPDNVTDSDSEFFYILAPPDRRDRGKDHHRDRERERDRKPNSSSRFGSKGTSSGPPSRRPTLDSSTDGGGSTRRGRSPAFSASSDRPELVRKDKHPSHHDRVPSSSHRSRSRDKEKEPKRSAQTPLVGVQHQLPPEPLKPPPMQPAPPPLQLPNIPSFAVEAGPRGPRELSMDEQKSAWHERIDLMFTSIASRRDYTKLESDLAQIRLLSNSALANGMPETDRTNISAQKTSLELQMEGKRREVNETIQKLVGSTFWPVLRTPQISEIEKTVREAKKHVLEVRSLLDDVKNSCTALFKTSASDGTQDLERSSKRRKIEGKADTPGQSTSGDVEDASENPTWELEAFHEKLIELDHHLVDLENDIIQRDQIISDEIELHVDARLEAEDALYPPIGEPAEVSQTEIEAVVDAKNKELVRAVTLTGREIEILVQEVAGLITKVDSLEAKCRALEAENHEFKSKLAQTTINHARSQNALVRRDKEIEAIAAALQAYISQASTGQSTDDLPSPEYIIEALGSQLDGLFREKFCATLVDVQRDVFDKVEETHNRTINAISPKILLLLKMVSLITARVGRSDMESMHTG